MRFTIADLDGAGRLGEHRSGVVTLDDDASGAGWFVDPTPGDDAEFAGLDASTQLRALGGAAWGRVDLLTVVLHELAHEWGFADRGATSALFHLMSETLELGVRRLPAAAVTTVVTSAEWFAPDGTLLTSVVESGAESSAAAVRREEHASESAVVVPSLPAVLLFAPPERDAVPGWFPDDDFALSGVPVG